MTTSGLNCALLRAFRLTNYFVDAPDGELLLRADDPNAALTSLLRSEGAACAAVVTAFNPHGELREETENRAAQTSLKRDLEASGRGFLSGRNVDPSGHWPIEKSFLVFGMDLPEARTLAARYGQLAFLWMDARSATPRLVETAASL